jgi:hypothetical protein
MASKLKRPYLSKRAGLAYFNPSFRAFCYFCKVKHFLFSVFIFLSGFLLSQENPNLNPVQNQNQLKIKQLIEKKAEYHRLTEGVQDGYRIKIHFGIDRDAAEAVKVKFTNRFPEYQTHKEYQQPNFVVLVGDFKTKLEAYESWKKIQVEFPAFIVKSKIKVLKD